MERQNVEPIKEKIIGITSFRIELNQNTDFIFSSDLIVRYLFFLIRDTM